MTIQELIDVLNTFEDKTKTVMFSTSESDFKVGCVLSDDKNDDERVWIFSEEEGDELNGAESK